METAQSTAASTVSGACTFDLKPEISGSRSRPIWHRPSLVLIRLWVEISICTVNAQDSKHDAFAAESTYSERSEPSIVYKEERCTYPARILYSYVLHLRQAARGTTPRQTPQDVQTESLAFADGCLYTEPPRA